ncbi:MAG: hypothetical protein LBH90_09010 [Tannerella sp.]|jgi:hypothetical protein|nr:hypothetical protein [Tannerella sp.]
MKEMIFLLLSGFLYLSAMVQAPAFPEVESHGRYTTKRQDSTLYSVTKPVSFIIETAFQTAKETIENNKIQLNLFIVLIRL